MSSGRDGEESGPPVRVSRESRGRWFIFRSEEGFEWSRVALPVAGLAEGLVGLRIVHLSDLHIRGGWSRAFDRLIDAIASAEADLLLITGDFADDKNDCRPALPVLRRLIPKLRARLGVWGILGNHDVDLLEPYLMEMGVNMIDGRRALVETPGSTRAHIELIGLPGVARADLDGEFLQSIPAKEPGTLRIVLSHYPDHIRRVRPLKADLFLAGHTHGGQCCLPGGRPIITHDALPRRLCKGVHDYEGTWLVVSRGFGFAGIPLRVFCPGEVGEIVVREGC